MPVELARSPFADHAPGSSMFYASSSVEADKLASLALEAATQLDAWERGLNPNMQALRKFAEAMSRFSGIDSDTGAGTYWLDPTSSEMFSSALTRATHRSVSNVDALNDELHSIIMDLNKELDGNQSIAAIKKFCLEIHGFILRARMSAGLHERGVFDYDHSYSG